MNTIRTQWHPAFCSAMRLEFLDDQGELRFTNEYNLNTKPLQIDLLVIKKAPDAVIRNEIGKIFRGHNIMEYKSPGDAMNIDTYYKSLAYAYLYKASGDHTDSIPADDITVSLVRERKPLKLFHRLRELGFDIRNEFPGIYYICRDGFPPTQIIVSGELTERLHRWLTALTGDMKKERAERFIADVGTLSGQGGRRYADSVMSVVVKENHRLFETLKKEGNEMCEELMKLMEPEIRQVEKRALERGLERGLEEGYRSLSKLIGLGLITEEQAAGQVADGEGFIKWLREAEKM